MNLVDVLVLVGLIIGTFIGYKRGVIKSLVSFLGIIMVTILAYTLKGKLADWLVSFMPFYDFGGVFAGIKSINVLFYNVVSFILLFVILYCILSIILSMAGLIDKLLRKTVILAIPDKILGAVVGFCEGTLFVFVVISTLVLIPSTQSYVMESKYGVRILERTPVVRTVLANSTLASEEIYQLVNNYASSDDKTNCNIEVMNTLVKYRIISASQAQKLADDNKLNLQNVKFS